MAEQKKTWSKPMLIVLGRETPEEHVLLKCNTAITGCGPGGFGGANLSDS